MMEVVDADRIDFALPDWVRARAETVRPLDGDESRMRFVVDLSREQIVRGTGGPFAAAVFESATGTLVAAGVNLVEHARNSMLHAEVVALMLAERRLETYSLSAAGLPPLELVTSSTPCAMCLGAVLWSGVRRLVCGARTEDVRAIGLRRRARLSRVVHPPRTLRHHHRARRLPRRRGPGPPRVRADGRADIQRLKSRPFTGADAVRSRS